MDCRKCGARLDLPKGREGVVACEYCGTKTWLEQERGGDAALGRPSAQVPEPAHAPGRGAGARQSRKRPLFVLLFGVAPLAIGSAMVANTMMRGSGPGVGAFAGGGFGPQGSGWVSGACLVDADGSDVLDFAGLTGDHETTQAALLDGRTGEILWQGGSFAGTDRILCPLEGWFAVASNEHFTVTFFPVSAPERGQVTRTLSDELRDFGAGDGCVVLRSSDERTVGVALPKGTAMKCEAEPSSSIHDPPGVQSSITNHSYHVEHEGITYTLRERKKGTAFLEASASRKGEELWDVPLRVVRFGGVAGELAIRPAPGTAVVFGSSRADDDKGIMLGLDAATGVERWSRPLAPRLGLTMLSLHYNGRYVVYTEGWKDEIVAIEPATGEEIWRVGR